MHRKRHFSVKQFQPTPGPLAATCKWCCQRPHLLSSFISCSVPAKALYGLHVVTMYVSVLECIVIDDDKFIRIASYHTGSLIAGGHCVIQTNPVFTWFACLISSHMKCIIFAPFLLVCLFRGWVWDSIVSWSIRDCREIYFPDPTLNLQSSGFDSRKQSALPLHGCRNDCGGTEYFLPRGDRPQLYQVWSSLAL